RVRAALPTVALVAPMVAVSIVVCGRGGASLTCGGLLAVTLLAALWRGQEFARGARAGLAAGAGALLLPLATCFHLCAGGVCLIAPSACVASGVLGGAVIGWRARGRAGMESRAGSYVGPALVVAALAGSLGCVIAGLGGVLGMSAGMAAAVGPALWWPRRAA
ncbi:MAG TPA: hypothetical protein VGQ33_19770, partial [Vicinamibacteria bacterium]|nr:hypothetical protein [Vicinamibacteria bacterium]